MRPDLATRLDLEPHPEGGWYRRTWTATTSVASPDGRTRPTATAILFALATGESSRWHRVASEEVWVAQVGAVALELGGTGEAPAASGAAATVVGCDVAAGRQPQAVVPALTWQRTLPGPEDALVTCVVSPGFDFDDLELHQDG